MVNKTRYMNLLKFKAYMKKRIVKKISETKMSINVNTDSYPYKSSTIIKGKYRTRTKVDLLEWLFVNFRYTKKMIHSYISKNSNWYWNHHNKFINIKINNTLLNKTKKEEKTLVVHIKNVLSSTYSGKQFTHIGLENEPEFEWHIDDEYHHQKYKNRFVISQSEKENLGTQYIYCPRLKFHKDLIVKFGRNISHIFACLETLTDEFCKKQSKKYIAKELMLSNIPSYLFHKSPEYVKNSCQRKVWVFEEDRSI